MSVIRKIFFGNLEAGLCAYVLTRSAMLAFAGFLCGYYVWAFPLLHAAQLQELVFKDGLIIWAMVALTYIWKYQFRMFTACMIGAGVACIFWVTFGLPYPDNVFGAVVGGWSIVLGVSEGPKVNHYV